mmetsp:Transcript_9923/g.15279  ORF Transcript_9923/g.15279 Transcript_9923/m.15279 type:complete len:588 (-) Transcript_9923:210-1973(-)|eukprot:CAMPEP_0195295394 /NCGR_PEP_ID=MMETSP0707-20130614/17298_1 /TAXON_ID=33640 /ORGANISM="Asterionellopsis glacialis, Strain CCMP134" /LENGTH=587 /DNA_ID=CAMNT_0040356621 /DNA_START=108 /DNA_END=1871 /DNA_ORIENTATION=+
MSMSNQFEFQRGSAGAMALQERDEQIASLRNQVAMLKKKIALHESSTTSSTKSGQKRRFRPLVSSHATTVHENMSIDGNGKRELTKTRERMGRNASIATREILNSLPSDDSTSQHPLAVRIMEMFQNPTSHMEYLNSEQFPRDLLKLCQKVRHLLEKEPRVAFVQSPAYVFGDIHGNLEDLHFFSDNIWRLGMSLTAGNFVFLGDYVDRGMSCLECVAYLLAMKLMLPHKVTLLRGNHETRDVNGWEEHYGERSFMYQCRARFGDDLGYKIWEQSNQVFDRMPLAAVIDQDIFCVHGGIPRPVHGTAAHANAGGSNSPASGDGREGEPRQSRIQDILNVPRIAGINPPYEHEDDDYQQVASDCIWSDPASDDQEARSVDPDTGFGESLRGGGAICFGHKAVTQFLKEQGMSYIMRAHEAHAEGVAVSKGARVFTVFSTSKDHNQGSQAMAGCILVDSDKLQVINRSPAYRNQYVHRRDSVSLAAVSDSEIQQRIRLGLVTTSPSKDEDDEEDEEDDEEGEEHWDDFEEDDNGFGRQPSGRFSAIHEGNEEDSDHEDHSDAGADEDVDTVDGEDCDDDDDDDPMDSVT